MIFLFANQAQSTLAAGLPATGAGSTTIALATGTGTLFPSPGAGEGFKLCLTDAPTQTLTEICLCTGRSADTLTVIRSQEGTTARAWDAGDIAANNMTAGSLANAVQADSIQSGSLEILTVVGGSVNAITGTLATNLTSLYDGLQVRFPAIGANTGPVTFGLTLGATATGVLPVFIANPAATNGYSSVIGGTIPCADYPLSLTYSASLPGALSGWVLSPIAPASLSARAWANFSGGTLNASSNIASWSRASAGVYDFTFTYDLPSAQWGITWGADSGVATAGAFVSGKANSGGVINGFDTNTGAAKDVDGTIVVWSS